MICLTNQPHPGAAVVAECGFPSIAERLGARIGRYKLLEKIGEGGFGVVWMAEQEQPLRRRVALKIIKPGMDTREVVARFEAERQALAMMEHPVLQASKGDLAIIPNSSGAYLFRVRPPP